jgi:hemoglobin-like flavoprotein
LHATRTTTLVQTSFARLSPAADRLVERFYEELFLRHPEVRPMFRGDIRVQERALLGALKLAVGALDRPDTLLPVLHELGARHAGYGVQPAHYGVVRDVLLDCLAEATGPLWEEALATAWRDAIEQIAAAMLAGAAQSAARH